MKEFVVNNKKFLLFILWLIVVIGIIMAIIFGTLNGVANKKEVKLDKYSVKTLKEVVGKKKVDAFSTDSSSNGGQNMLQYTIMYEKDEVSLEEIEEYINYFLDEDYEVVDDFDEREGKYQMVYDDVTIGIHFIYANDILKVSYYNISN